MRKDLLKYEPQGRTPEITPERHQTTEVQQEAATKIRDFVKKILLAKKEKEISSQLDELPEKIRELLRENDNNRKEIKKFRTQKANDSQTIEQLKEQIEQLREENTHLKKVVYKPAEQPADLRSKSPIMPKRRSS